MNAALVSPSTPLSLPIRRRRAPAASVIRVVWPAGGQAATADAIWPQPRDFITLRAMSEAESDESLMLAYARGDAAAFATLYQRHRNPLFGFLLRQTQDRARCEDLFQEVWGRVIQSRARYEASAKFTTFLFHIAHNLLIDQSRRARPQASADETERVFAQLSEDESEQPENRLNRDEQQQRLLSAIAELPEDQREAFLLRAEEGLDVESIASVTGVGFETAKSRLRYALRKLKEALQP